MNWYLAVLKNYAVFDGRASRTEFWMFTLFNLIIAVALGVVDAIIDIKGALGVLYALGVLLPTIGVEIRRLHDIGRSGWWLFITLVPLLGAIVLLVFLCQRSQDGDNQYGPNPLGTSPPPL